MRLKAALIAATVTLMGASLAWAGGAHQDFQLTNATGDTIDKVFVSPASEESWEEDVLGRDTLDDGESTNIHFERDTTPCKWDIKVIYTDGEAVAWGGIDLCSVSAITIHWDKASGKTSAEVH